MTNKNKEAFEQMRKLTKEAKKFYADNYNPGSLYPPRDTKFFLNEEYIPFDFETDYDDPLYKEYCRVRMLQAPFEDEKEKQEISNSEETSIKATDKSFDDNANDNIKPTKGITDYFIDNLTDIGYGVDRALSGATFGGYDWLKQKTGIGIDEEKYLDHKKQTDGSEMAARIGGTIAEIGGNIMGGGGGLVNSLRQAGLRGAKLATASGTIGGGLYGLSSSNSWSEMPYNTAVGSISGGVLGGLGDVGARAVGRMASPYVKKMFNIPKNTSKQTAYNDFIQNNAADEMVDFLPRNSVSNSRLFDKVAPDDSQITMINVDNVPQFGKIADLRRWLKNKFSEARNKEIYSTGEMVNFNNSGANRIIKNAKKPINNLVYSKLEDIVSNGYYSGIRPSDMRHVYSNRGQNIYHSGIMYKGEPYSVEFYVDQPLSQFPDGLHNYAGQNIKKIQQVARDVALGAADTGFHTKQPADIYYLADLRGKVNPEIRNISNIYEGLNAYQAGSLDAAIEIGASRSANKVGSLEHINKVKEALEDMITSPSNAYYRDSLIEVKNRVDDILQTKAGEILRPYNAYENFVNSISDKMQYISPYRRILYAKQTTALSFYSRRLFF